MRLVGLANRTPHVEEGINNYIVQGRLDAVNAFTVDVSR
jgi:hypothetical protein